MEDQIVSAALYWQAGSEGRLSRAWLDTVFSFFSQHALPIQEYSVPDTRFCKSGNYSFAKRHAQLESCLKTEALPSLYLYAHRGEQRGLLLSWQGAASINLSSGTAFLGIPASEGVSLRDLFLFAVELTDQVIRPPYGIGYIHLSLQAPSLYAVGLLGGVGVPTFNEHPPGYGEQLGRWLVESSKGARHLRGWFRDVYPVSLLSEQHVNADLGQGQTLRTSGWGTLTPISQQRWLWEVPDHQIAPARATLLRAGLLICQ
jgi:hypothetical protein